MLFRSSWYYVLLILMEMPSLQGLAQYKVYPYVQWGEQHGLIDNAVYDIASDKEGFLWIGTANGLSRFDGSNFKDFQFNPLEANSIASNSIIRLLVDSQNRLWIGTGGGGLSVYQSSIEGFTNYKVPTLIEDRINCIYEDSMGQIWIGYRAIGNGAGGLTLIDINGNIEHFLVGIEDYAGFKLKVSSILQDPVQPNIYWLGGRSFFRWNRDTDELLEFPHSKMVPNYQDIQGIESWGEQHLLVGSFYAGVLLFNKENLNWELPLLSGNALALKQLSDGNLWFSIDKRIGYFEKGEKVPIIVFAPNGSPLTETTRIENIHIGAQSNLWLASGNMGFFCWNPIMNQFPAHQILSGPDSTSFKFPEWIPTTETKYWYFKHADGVALTDSSFNTLKNIVNPLINEPIIGVVTNSSGMVYTDHHLLSVDQHYQKLEVLSLSDRQQSGLDTISIYRVMKDTQGRVWLGTRNNGLYCIRPDDAALYQYRHEPGNLNSLCHDNYIFEIEEDKYGHIWVSTDKGLSILDPIKEDFFDYSVLRKLLGSFVIHALEPDASGNMWIGTRMQGLFKCSLDGQNCQQFTVKDGLPYNGVNKLAVQGRYLWFCTRSGLGKLDLTNDKIESFDEQKGLITKKLYDARLSALPSGQMMLTYENSPYFTLFNADEVEGQVGKPLLAIQQFNYLNRSPIKKLKVKSGDTLVLCPNDNYFSIGFEGIHFLRPRGMQYQYRLLGYDDVWVDGANNQVAVFTNLPGGKYRFEVKAKTNEGLYSATQYLTIFLPVPWYKTLWFLLMLMVSLSLLIFWVYRIRVRRIQKESELQKKLAETEIKSLRSQINPHFIFNCLNSIKNYIIQKDAIEGVKHINRFSKLIRMVLNHSAERFISLDRELEALELYIALEQMRFQNKFEAQIEASIQTPLSEMLIPPLLLQPYVENAIWHGLMPLPSGGALNIRLEEQKGMLCIWIKDNGIGRRQSMIKKGKTQTGQKSLGLRLNANRIATINQVYKLDAKIKIMDVDPSNQERPGTLVFIQFPIQNK